MYIVLIILLFLDCKMNKCNNQNVYSNIKVKHNNFSNIKLVI